MSVLTILMKIELSETQSDAIVKLLVKLYKVLIVATKDVSFK
jgi:hypothetical protein